MFNPNQGAEKHGRVPGAGEEVSLSNSALTKTFGFFLPGLWQEKGAAGDNGGRLSRAARGSAAALEAGEQVSPRPQHQGPGLFFSLGLTE